jgi:RimJ/RimL family protein N-acetyltransferase
MAQPAGAVVVLAGGEQVQVRPVRPDDAPLIAAGFERLDPVSRRLRFFAPMPRLSPSLLRWMVEVDHHDHEALVAVLADGADAGKLVGVARYVRLRQDPAAAEVAVTVGQHRRRQGLGTALLRALRLAALANGVERFTGEVMAENRPTLAWLQAAGATIDYAEPRTPSFSVALRRHRAPTAAAS